MYDNEEKVWLGLGEKGMKRARRDP